MRVLIKPAFFVFLLVGHSVVAARLTIEFRRLLPLGTRATLEAWVEQTDGRKVTTRGRLLDASGDPFAEAEGLFIMLPRERFGTNRRPRRRSVCVEDELSKAKRDGHAN